MLKLLNIVVLCIWACTVTHAVTTPTATPIVTQANIGTDQWDLSPGCNHQIRHFFPHLQHQYNQLPTRPTSFDAHLAEWLRQQPGSALVKLPICAPAKTAFLHYKAPELFVKLRIQNEPEPLVFDQLPSRRLWLLSSMPKSDRHLQWGMDQRLSVKRTSWFSLFRRPASVFLPMLPVVPWFFSIRCPGRRSAYVSCWEATGEWARNGTTVDHIEVASSPQGAGTLYPERAHRLTTDLKQYANRLNDVADE